VDLMNQDSMGTDTEVYSDTEENTPLPVGVHPADMSEAVLPGFGNNAPVPQDSVGNKYSRTTPAWDVDNVDATAVFERSAHDFTARVVVVDINNGGTAVACNRVKGRKAVTLSVPALLSTGAAPLGVLYGPTEDAVQQPASVPMNVLNVGDSITIATEAQIWVAPIPGNATGAVQVIEELNPTGGALGTGV
jgi:hypothetical protein